MPAAEPYCVDQDKESRDIDGVVKMSSNNTNEESYNNNDMKDRGDEDIPVDKDSEITKTPDTKETMPIALSQLVEKAPSVDSETMETPDTNNTMPMPLSKAPSVDSETMKTPDSKETMPQLVEKAPSVDSETMKTPYVGKDYWDMPLSQLDADKFEQAGLIERRDERCSTVKKFKQELTDIQNKSKDPKGKDMSQRIQKSRKQLVLNIIRSSTIKYASQEHEYKAIGKFYRGMFRKVAYNDSGVRKDRLFDETEHATLMEIARAYGAFDY